MTSEENRQETRFIEIGRVDIPDISSMPGILDDISLTGCKIHFPFTVPVELDTEFKVKIILSRNPELSPLNLICKAIWVQDDMDETKVGLQNLYSPDEAKLKEFIKLLKDETFDDFPDIN